MTDAQINQDMEDVHVTLTAEPPIVQQQSSSVSSDLVSKYINPSPDTGIDSILNQNVQSHNLVNVPVSVSHVTPSYASTIPQPPVPIIQTLQQTPYSTTTTTIPITTLPDIPNFASLREKAQAENEEFLSQIDSNIKAIIKDQVKAQVSKILPKVEKYVTESLGAEVLVRSTNQPQTPYANLYNALIESYNSDKDIFSSYGDVVTLKRGRDDQDKNEDPSAGSNQGSKKRRSGKEAESSKEPTNKESKSISSFKGVSRSQPKSSGKSAQAEEHGQKVDDLEEQSYQEFNTRNNDATLVRETIDDKPPQTWITQLAQAAGTQSSFNEFLATPIEFSAFIMNRLKIENLTQDVLNGPTYDLMKGTCKSVAKLEYHLEEVFKATNDQLDWHNPEGRPYPHDLSKPLPLILNARGRQVIPFDHFINNDLEYLKGGSLSQRYTTSITKTKVADYGHVKWIDDKWGPKCQKFYRYAANMETSKDVYSRHRIIAVTSLKIMQFFCYSHLEEIIVRRPDDQLYNFRDGDFKRLRRQDIKDMLLLLVQERVEDLQLGVKSYQKKINLSRPDSYRSDLRKMTPYTAYPDIQCIIYQDDMDKNHLMRTEELYKFSNGPLNHVRNALNDIAIGI
ncbi:hypothetical protein Tco_0591748 [Tanacetum coccineum]